MHTLSTSIALKNDDPVYNKGTDASWIVVHKMETSYMETSAEIEWS